MGPAPISSHTRNVSVPSWALRTCATRNRRDLLFQRGANVPEPSLSTPPAATVTRVLAGLVMSLMLVAIIYATWIAIRNWSHIGV